MMKNLKILSLLILVFTFFNASAQNCGYVDDFRKTVVDNGDSTSTYNFEIDVKTTSGGSKSVRMRIDCNSYLFESNECLKTGTSVITYYYGPYTLAHSVCNVSPSIIWTGHTNDKCGGATCIGETITLPVTMVDFNAVRTGQKVVLDWSTASEINNKGFEVYHSTDEIVWNKIGWVDGNGDSYNLNTYTFVHENPTEGQNFYQLKQIDFDGQFDFTSITYVRSIHDSKDKKISVFPNPFDNKISISGEFESIKVLSLSGKEVQVTIANKTIDTSNLLPGIYFIEATTESGVETIRVIK